MHGPPLLPVAPALQAQLVETVLPAGEFERPRHAWQVGGDVAAMVGENLPAAQLVHTPPAAENFPAAQLVQLLPAFDPAGEDLPATQSLHDCAAVVAEANLPAAQLVHKPPAAENLPAAQMVQSLPASDPGGEDLPAAQLVQTPPPTNDL